MAGRWSRVTRRLAELALVVGLMLLAGTGTGAPAALAPDDPNWLQYKQRFLTD